MLLVVGDVGLEPTHRLILVPKTSASTIPPVTHLLRIAPQRYMKPTFL